MRFNEMTIRRVLVGAIAMFCAGSASAQGTSPPPAPAADLQPAAGPASVLTSRKGGQFIHAMPTVPLANRIKAGQTGGPNDLVYHSGGLIMKSAKIYAIFWEPPKMQNGEKTIPFKPDYIQRQESMLGLYDRHGLAKNNTQYYQIVGGKKTFITDKGQFAESFIDKKTKFPAPDCHDRATPGNCLSDTQLKAEIDKVSKSQKWPRNFQTIIFIYTPKGMGSCFDSSSNSCAYTAYCAYHSGFGPFASPVIYANEPYGDPKVCWDGGPSPSGDIAIDSALDTSSHELTEAITDPAGNAWFNPSAGEIGDICNFTFGPSKFDGGKANQNWNGKFFRLQEEYSNKQSKCVQSGP